MSARSYCNESEFLLKLCIKLICGNKLLRSRIDKISPYSKV